MDIKEKIQSVLDGMNAGDVLDESWQTDPSKRIGSLKRILHKKNLDPSTIAELRTQIAQLEQVYGKKLPSDPIEMHGVLAQRAKVARDQADAEGDHYSGKHANNIYNAHMASAKAHRTGSSKDHREAYDRHRFASSDFSGKTHADHKRWSAEHYKNLKSEDQLEILRARLDRERIQSGRPVRRGL